MTEVRFSGPSRLATALAVIACAAALTGAAIRTLLAARDANMRDLGGLTEAVRIEPNNSDLWRRLGLLRERSAKHRNLALAIKYLRHAAQLDPSSAELWLELASVYGDSGEESQALQAYRRAQADYPVSADVAWRFGSFLLRHGNQQEAAKKIRRALLDEPKLTPSAVSQFWNAGAGIQLILDRVLPPLPRVYLSAIDYFVGRKENDAALACWKKLAGLGAPVPLHRSLDLIDNLLAQDRVEDAVRVWRQALRASGRSGQKDAPGSLIFNGGFEHPFVNGGFGWRQRPAAGTAFDLVDTITHAGSQSARVVFYGTANIDYANLLQYVPVTPGRRYRFSAFMRTQFISTDSGPRFLIDSCPAQSKIEAQTPAMTGTHPWTKLQAQFTAGPATRCVAVVLNRKPSHMFDNKIRGAVWVDDVQLKPLPPAGAGRP